MQPDKIIKLLNKTLANLQLEYVKLHNYHWNVKGMNFKSVHEMTEAFYDYFAGQYDEVAERIVQLGGNPSASLQDYLTNASLKEENKNEFDVKYVLGSVLNDFEALDTGFKEISRIAGESDDAPTSDIADNNIIWLEKQIWMIKASLA